MSTDASQHFACQHLTQVQREYRRNHDEEAFLARGVIVALGMNRSAKKRAYPNWVRPTSKPYVFLGRQ